MAIARGAYHSVALKSDGSLWAWGGNKQGQLGLGDHAERDIPTRVGAGRHWAFVACGHGQTLAVKSDGSLWAWGWNNQGQLGLGDHRDRDVPPASAPPTTGWPSPAAAITAWA